MSFKVDILFEDPWVVAINKPAGFPVHATRDKLRPHIQGLLEKASGSSRVLFHRLDVDTTGVLLFGKLPEANKPFTELFRDRKITKTYSALVEGSWNPISLHHTSFIRQDGNRGYVSSTKGKATERAETFFEVKKIFSDFSWIQAKPITGRTHQIRLHCKDLGNPILGDRIYGRAHKNAIPLALHAFQLEFNHPISKKDIQIVAPLPSHWSQYGFKF